MFNDNKPKKKYNRANVGSVIKSNDPNKPDYIKFNLYQVNGSLTLKDGQILSLETKAFQLKSLNAAVASGKLTEDVASKSRERIEKIPDFVRGELILVTKND